MYSEVKEQRLHVLVDNYEVVHKHNWVFDICDMTMLARHKMVVN